MPMSARHMRTATIHALAAMLLTGVTRLPHQHSLPVFPRTGPFKPVSVGVGDLVSKMTPEEKTSQLLNQARAIPRLQVPASDWWSEALRGVANAATATVFPEPIGLAATLMLL
jgi:beta-glucosidase